MAAVVLVTPDLLPIITAYQHGVVEDTNGLYRLLAAVDLSALHYLQLMGDPRYPGACYRAFAAVRKRLHPAALQRVEFSRYRPIVVYYALVFGLLPVVKRMRASSRAAISNSQWAVAAAFGHFAIVEHLHLHDSGSYDPRAMKAAVVQGNLAMVLYLADLGYWTPDVLRWAVAGGQVAIAEFAFDRRTATDGPLGAPSINEAARLGHVDALRFVHERRLDGFSDEAVDIAAANGDLDVVRFLFRKRRLRGSPRAMYYAVESNYADVVQYLDEHSEANDIAGSLRRAARCGHIEIVRYFCSHYEGETLLSGAVCAAKEGLLAAATVEHKQRCHAVLAYLHRLRPEMAPEDRPCVIQ
ncbi:hypothetical protein ACHHYP_17367 [Achlya hypogyna]|uniref:Uncharacterized protein n=1 Tax=Achlya hypogyna TaxID=1202772 RepID=A0A1V9Y4K5_ACHHY|nr:hypothetical protein ACHHYP_17367 [Achlya hypogyna]